MGHYVAMYNLGVLYDFGRGFPEDNEEAVRWYKMSAEHDYTQAQTNLGLMYRTGEGVPKDFKKGAEYYLLAAEQGDPNGQRQYGYVLLIGEGVRRNRVEALKWFMLAMDQGDKRTRDAIRDNGWFWIKSEQDEARRRADAWKRKWSK